MQEHVVAGGQRWLQRMGNERLCVIRLDRDAILEDDDVLQSLARFSQRFFHKLLAVHAARMTSESPVASGSRCGATHARSHSCLLALLVVVS